MDNVRRAKEFLNTTPIPVSKWRGHILDELGISDDDDHLPQYQAPIWALALILHVDDHITDADARDAFRKRMRPLSLRWHVLDEDGWTRLRARLGEALIAMARDSVAAIQPSTDSGPWPSIARACRMSVSYLRRGGDREPVREEVEAARKTALEAAFAAGNFAYCPRAKARAAHALGAAAVAETARTATGHPISIVSAAERAADALMWSGVRTESKAFAIIADAIVRVMTTEVGQ